MKVFRVSKPKESTSHATTRTTLPAKEVRIHEKAINEKAVTIATVYASLPVAAIEFH